MASFIDRPCLTQSIQHPGFSIGTSYKNAYVTPALINLRYWPASALLIVNRNKCGSNDVTCRSWVKSAVVKWHFEGGGIFTLISKEFPPLCWKSSRNETGKGSLLQASVFLMHMSWIHNQLYAVDDLGRHVIMTNY